MLFQTGAGFTPKSKITRQRLVVASGLYLALWALTQLVGAPQARMAVAEKHMPVQDCPRLSLVRSMDSRGRRVERTLDLTMLLKMALGSDARLGLCTASRARR
jgi:hypothetical protein